MKGLCLVLLTGVFALSCTLFPVRRARDVYVRSGSERLLSNAAFRLEEVTVERGLESETVRENARSIFALLFARLAQNAGPSAPRLSVRASIKEEPFVQSFRSLNAVTVELSILDGDGGDPLALVLYSENTESTVLSYAYLYSTIRAAVMLVSR
jgi:hypothetical protein